MDPEEYAQKFSTTVMNGYVSLQIVVGHTLGLFDALKKFTKPVTSQELAESCKLKERYVREWLGCLSAAEFINITDDHKYFIPEACKPHITESSFLACELPNVAKNMPSVLECFKKDGPKGFNYATQIDSLMWLDEEKKACKGEWIDDNLFPTGKKNKDDIHYILDIGCATGSLTVNIAKHFPNAKVFGIDLDQTAIAKAKENIIVENVLNIEFHQCGADVLEKTWENQFDWIVLVDVLHDLPNPEQCIKEIKRVLKKDGIVSAIDPAFHSDHKMNVGNPRAPMLYTFSTFVCLPCSMSAEPAVGHGVGWGMENKIAFLKANGFEILGDEDKPLVHFRKVQD